MVSRRIKNIRHVDKPKLLLDEGLPRRQTFLRLNRYCDIKHIKYDYRKAGVSDEIVYKIANQDRRIVVTFNTKDFRFKPSNNTMSIIGLDPNISTKQIDANLSSWVRKCKPSDYFGKYIKID